MDKTTSFRKVGAIYGIFFSKEQGKALKGKPDGTLQVDVFAVHQLGAAFDDPTTNFYNRIIV